jgi:hypothetical protein
MGKVDSKRNNRSPTERSLTDQMSIPPLEVAIPLVTARVKQTDDFPCPGIPARNVWPFVQITGIAGQREVGGGCLSSVLLGDDMIDMKGQLVVQIWQKTIFTASGCAVPDELFKERIHRDRLTARPLAFSEILALDFRIDRKWPILSYLSASIFSVGVSWFFFAFSNKMCIR